MIATAELSVPQEEARELYGRWLKANRSDATKRDAAIKNAYRELARGRKVIDLKRTIQNAGVDDQNRPLLAAIRADAKVCQYTSDQYTTPVFLADGRRTRDKETPTIKSVIRMGAGTMPHCLGDRGWWRELKAIVPVTPPWLRPKGHLRNYVVLWEADWEDAPIDPLLLKPLGGAMYAVVAQWDLTPIERAALRGDFD